MLYRMIFKPGPRLFFLRYLIVGTLHEASGAGWKRKGNVTGEGIMDIWATSSCNFLLPSEPTRARSLIFHFYSLMCMYNSMTPLVGTHTSHKEQGRSHGNLVAHGQVFYFYEGPVAGSELSLAPQDGKTAPTSQGPAL